MITSLGEKRASRVFVSLSCLRYCLSSSLPLGVGSWLPLVVVSAPGFFIFYGRLNRMKVIPRDHPSYLCAITNADEFPGLSV